MNHLEDEQLQFYVDGLLPWNELLAVDQHLAVCVDCDQQLAGLKRLVTDLANDRDLRLPDDFAERTAGLAWNPDRHSSSGGQVLTLFALACVALVLLLYIVQQEQLAQTPATALGTLGLLLESTLDTDPSLVPGLSAVAVLGCILAVPLLIRFGPRQHWLGHQSRGTKL